VELQDSPRHPVPIGGGSELGGAVLVGNRKVNGVERMPTGKRELIETGTDKRYVRRDEKGRFEDVVDVGKSLSQDRKRQAKHEAKPGQGDRGDRKR
jgi:hypothetical protein